jgi:hypothetical protein
MERIIAAHGKTVYAKNEDLYTVMAGDDGNDYIIELENNEKVWNKYMPPEESEDELACYEGPVLALPNVKIEKAQIPIDSEEPVKLMPPPKKKTLMSKPKPTESPKYQNVLQKDSYETTPPKKKIIKKKN